MKKWLQFLYLLSEKAVNNKISSRILRKFSGSSFSKRWIPWFISKFEVDLSENVKPLKDFTSLEDFFTREIQWQKRAINYDPNVVVSPVDGQLSFVDEIDEKMSFHVKGKDYSLEDLFRNKTRAEQYKGGTLFILYLSPKNYHRFHAPIDSIEINCSYLGSHSYPVNSFGLEYGKKTLTDNYRMIELMESRAGEYAFIAVGAQNVNSIIKTAKQKELKKMNEIGFFSFGSTVLLIFQKDKIRVSDPNPRTIRAGEEIAKIQTK